jgi:ABC-type lipopolysaccharide export system ATPase subunit
MTGLTSGALPALKPEYDGRTVDPVMNSPMSPNLVIQSGGIVVMLDPNGAGKTTSISFMLACTSRGESR